MPFSNYMYTAEAPGSGTLFWDNIKTTFIQGGNVTAIFTGVIGGAAGAIIGCPTGTIQLTVPIGYIATSIPAFIVGGVTGLLLSPCFTLAAMLTRDFKTHADIDPRVAQILSFSDSEYDKRYIIHQIIKEFKRLEWWRFISSHESRRLITTLSEASAEDAWEALTHYIKKTETSCFSDSHYEHNGKKHLTLFYQLQNNYNHEKIYLMR